MTSRPNGHDGEVMIDVDRLQRYYGPAPALQDISFRAKRGEIVGFLGPNGAGKTTTMRILTGYMPPSSGTATIAGHDVVRESMEARRNVGYLPETTPLYPEMTVWGYLEFMARLRGVRKPADAIGRAVEKVALEERVDQLIGQLSKGLRQRVGIAQAVLHDPPVIILDEPTIGLDPRQIREVRGLIQELGGEHTVILSTHILPEAQQVCDRVLIIHRGRIVAEDSPERLTHRLTGGQRVRVTVPKDVAADAVTGTLSSVDGVSEVHVEGGGTYLITLDEGADPRAEIARSVVASDWRLLELTPIGMSLEDIFLELTRETEDEAGAAGLALTEERREDLSEEAAAAVDEADAPKDAAPATEEEPTDA